MELIKRARRLNPLVPAWHAEEPGLRLLLRGPVRAGDRGAGKERRSSLETRVFKALTYAQLGRKADAAREVEAILKEKPDFTARGWIANDIMEPGGSSEALFLDGARKAGLPIDQPAPTN